MAQNLAQIIKERGYASRLEFAKKVGIAGTTVNNWVNGRPIDPDVIDKVLRFLNLTVEDVIVNSAPSKAERTRNFGGSFIV